MRQKSIERIRLLAIAVLGEAFILGGCSPQSPIRWMPILFISNAKGGTVLTFKNLVGLAVNLAPDKQPLGSQTNLSAHLFASLPFHGFVSITVGLRRPLP
jgi:hypothetical protein